MQLRVSRPAAVMAALLICAGGVVLGATPAGADPGISVSPSTGLHNGQTATVTGSGFTKNQTVYIVECKAGATAETQCSFTFSDLSTVVAAKADANGNINSPSPVLKTSFKGIDCTKTPCEIAAHQTISTKLLPTNTAVRTIAFGGGGQPSSGHSAPAGSTHTTPGQPAPATTGSHPTSAGPTTAASSGASTAASTSVSSGTGSAQTSSSAGVQSSGSTPSTADGSSSPAAVVKVKADNNGRFVLIAIVAVLALLFVAAMARNGRRASGG